MWGGGAQIGRGGQWSGGDGGSVHCTTDKGGGMGPTSQSAASLLVGFENKLQNGCQPTVSFLVKYM